MKTGYELLLPQGILEYFEVVFIEESEKSIILHLDEKNIVPEEYSGCKVNILSVLLTEFYYLRPQF